MVENLLLFGAGASYDAGDVKPHNPPLGEALFSNLETRFPNTWGDLPTDIKQEFQNDFEKGMVAVGEYDSTLYVSLYQSMGAYFASFSLNNSENNYYRVIQSLKGSISSGNTILSTINYDLLIEDALDQADLEINHFPEDVGEAYSMLKFHGSCNFFSKGVSASGISFTEGMTIPGNVKTVSREEVIEYHEGGYGLYPAMALFRPDKFVQIGTTAIGRVQKIWRRTVQQAKNVGIVGVRPNPNDDQLWEPLSKTDGKLVYIGGEDCFNTWLNNHRNMPADDVIISNTFSGSVNEFVSHLD